MKPKANVASRATHRPQPQAGTRLTNVITFPYGFVLTQKEVTQLRNHVDMVSKAR